MNSFLIHRAASMPGSGLLHRAEMAGPGYAMLRCCVPVTLGPPPGEATLWSARMLAQAAVVSLRSVQRILEAHQLAPHRIRTFKLSNDPKFAEKLKDIVSLYVDPPAQCGRALGR
jgi:hypothetical protein